MSSANQANGRSDLLTKDALYLFELMRESPHPFLLHIGPYAEKTGTKANSIVKRLGDIKKRNNLNIITTTNAPGDSRSYTTPRPRQTGPRTPRDDDVARPTVVKRERKSKTASEANTPDVLKTEATDTPTPTATAIHSLLTPAPSPKATKRDSPPATKLTTSTNKPATSASMAPIRTDLATQMPLYMPQKRTLDDFGADYCANDKGNVLKKAKTETWSFS